MGCSYPVVNGKEEDMVRELTCIQCPMGCQLTVTETPDGKIDVKGNTCPRGAQYGAKEVTNPTRIVTSTVPVANGEIARVSVKTKEDIPKGKIFDIMKEIHEVKVSAPIKTGDVIIADAAGTGVPVVATKDVAKAV